MHTRKQRWYARDAHSVGDDQLMGAAATLKWDALSALGAPSHPAAVAAAGAVASAGAGGAGTGGAGAGGAAASGAREGLRLWNAEAPDHYILVVELRGSAGEALEFEACQVGRTPASAFSAAVVGGLMVCGGRPGTNAMQPRMHRLRTRLCADFGRERCDATSRAIGEAQRVSLGHPNACCCRSASARRGSRAAACCTTARASSCAA
jgi:hypothetical protein